MKLKNLSKSQITFQLGNLENIIVGKGETSKEFIPTSAILTTLVRSYPVDKIRLVLGSDVELELIGNAVPAAQAYIDKPEVEEVEERPLETTEPESNLDEAEDEVEVIQSNSEQSELQNDLVDYTLDEKFFEANPGIEEFFEKEGLKVGTVVQISLTDETGKDGKFINNGDGWIPVVIEEEKVVETKGTQEILEEDATTESDKKD